MGKVVEYVIHDQVYSHFIEHSLFHSNHHGFLRDHSTATATLMWLTASEDQKLSAALLLDLSAAFDFVDHLIFINKLQTYNFSSQTIKWFSSYLCR